MNSQAGSSAASDGSATPATRAGGVALILAGIASFFVIPVPLGFVIGAPLAATGGWMAARSG